MCTSSFVLCCRRDWDTSVCDGGGNATIVGAQELKGQKKAKLELLERHQSQLEALTQQENLLSKSLDSAMDTAKAKTLVDVKRRTRRRNKAVDVDEEYCELPKISPVGCFSGATLLTATLLASCFDHFRFGHQWSGIPL